MGGNINSLGKEYSPVISPDMKKNVFYWQRQGG